MIRQIIVEPSGYACLNMGDVAMMEVAVARLRGLFPHAAIKVVTACPDRLSSYCSSVTPMSAEARKAWLSSRFLIGSLYQKLPKSLSYPLRKLERELWLQRPQISDFEARIKAKLLHRSFLSPSRFRTRLAGADLLVVSGSGMFNDAFADSAIPLQDELESALRTGVPVIAFGQGIGPITNPLLLAKARAVLPRLKLIGLREARTGLPLLESLGVPRDRIYLTGDDAIELAYRRSPECLGNRIGINLRLADYAETGNDMADTLREPLLHVAQSLHASLVPVPISFHKADSDVASFKQLLGVEYKNSYVSIKTPEDAIRLIGQCRVMVTGSYHGGVFALAQGIPVVGLVHSPYYEQKFTGLQEQFPNGCRILDFRRPITPEEIRNAVSEAWNSADQSRESLLVAAACQVELSRAAYRAAGIQLGLNAVPEGQMDSSAEWAATRAT
jgi:colanic acid/amylovoran biosynthesis protein